MTPTKQPALDTKAKHDLEAAPLVDAPDPGRLNYLNADYGWKSWLFTTDHKRIAILYLISISIMFFIGGLMAVGIRLELITPPGDLVQAETYNKMFTMHGIVMVFFFLIPSIPAVLGNFLLPIMIGAKDLAFPRLNLASWYIYMIGAVITMVAMVHGGAVRPSPTRTSWWPASASSSRASRPS